MSEQAEEFRQDVWEVAAATAAEIGCKWNHDTTVIASAILAERKRCAEVATAEITRLTGDPFADSINGYVSHAILTGTP